jgi:hypothetical protein
VSRWPSLVVAVALAPIVHLAQGRVDDRVGHFRAQEEVLYLWSGESVKRLVPGFEDLAADVYWLRTVQYFGGTRAYVEGKRFELLRPLIDITTTLDPRLEIAYRYGAIFLCEAPPVGAGRPREGIGVLAKGVSMNPKSWYLAWYYGLFHYFFLHEPVRAAQILNKAATLPGAPFWLRLSAGDLIIEGSERSRARRLWQRMYDQADLEIVKRAARRRLKILDSLDAADRLTALVATFAKRTGRRPKRLEELREAGLWNGPFTDEAGIPFAYDEVTGRVELSARSPMRMSR